jgi:hypothetical protein
VHAMTDDRAVEHVEGREQGGRAVALVIMGHRATAPRPHRQTRLGAVEGLDLALLVDRQHHGMGRRVDVQPDGVPDLGGEMGIARELEAAYLVGRRPCVRQIRWTELTLSPLAAAIAGAVQCVTPSGGSSPNVRVTTVSTTAWGNGGCARAASCRAAALTPSAMNRSTSAVPQPSPLARMIRARQTLVSMETTFQPRRPA